MPTVKWNQGGNGNVHVSDGQEGYWATFGPSVTAAHALREYLRTADYGNATRAFTVTATVLKGRNKDDQAYATVRPVERDASRARRATRSPSRHRR
jgi:hypothetical protein